MNDYPPSDTLDLSTDHLVEVYSLPELIILLVNMLIDGRLVFPFTTQPYSFASNWWILAFLLCRINLQRWNMSSSKMFAGMYISLIHMLLLPDFCIVSLLLMVCYYIISAWLYLLRIIKVEVMSQKFTRLHFTEQRKFFFSLGY